MLKQKLQQIINKLKEFIDYAKEKAKEAWALILTVLNNLKAKLADWIGRVKELFRD